MTTSRALLPSLGYSQSIRTVAWKSLDRAYGPQAICGYEQRLKKKKKTQYSEVVNYQVLNSLGEELY